MAKFFTCRLCAIGQMFSVCKVYKRVYQKHQIFWIVNKPENSTKLNL